MRSDASYLAGGGDISFVKSPGRGRGHVASARRASMSGPDIVARLLCEGVKEGTCRVGYRSSAAAGEILLELLLLFFLKFELCPFKTFIDPPKRFPTPTFKDV